MTTGRWFLSSKEEEPLCGVEGAEARSQRGGVGGVEVETVNVQNSF